MKTVRIEEQAVVGKSVNLSTQELRLLQTQAAAFKNLAKDIKELRTVEGGNKPTPIKDLRAYNIKDILSNNDPHAIIESALNLHVFINKITADVTSDQESFDELFGNKEEQEVVENEL